MKTTRTILAATLFTVLAAISFAGPGPDYWARVQKAQQDKAKSETAQPAACAHCDCSAMKKA